jgi:hypothetical protein
MLLPLGLADDRTLDRIDELLRAAPGLEGMHEREIRVERRRTVEQGIDCRVLGVILHQGPCLQIDGVRFGRRRRRLPDSRTFLVGKRGLCAQNRSYAGPGAKVRLRPKRDGRSSCLSCSTMLSNTRAFGGGMTLEQWALVGQIGAAIAVIVSLIYVARQVKQNTNAMLVGNAQSLVELNNRLNTPFSVDREFAELWVKAGSDFGSLDAVDQQRLIAWEWQAIAAWSNYFDLRQKGLISDAQWSQLVWQFASLGQRQSVREAWKWLKPGYGQKFQNLMAQHLESDAVATGGS